MAESAIAETTTGPPIAGPAVWVVGDPALGQPQFNSALLTEAKDPDPVFVVGTSSAAEHWPQFHPGPLNGSTGMRERSSEIRFDAPPKTDGAFELALDLFASHGPCPQLEVRLNERRGLFFLEPERVGREGISTPHSPVSGWVHLRVPLLAEWFCAGENRIVLTTKHVDGPGDDERRDPHPFFGTWFGSGFQYSGLGLYHRALADLPEPVVRLSPLPLFVRDNAELLELADLVVSAPAGFASGTALVSIPEAAVELKADLPGCDFGDVRVRLAVPPLDGAALAAVDLTVDGEPFHHETNFAPCRKWTVHVIPHVHLDVGYTDVQGKVIELHSRNVERAVQILDEVPEYAFVLDGSFILQKFTESRNEAAKAKALDALRSGRIAMQAFYALFLSGLPTLEECYRAAYYSAKVRQGAGIPIEYANLTDVPSYSWAIPSVLRDLGIDCFMGIQNHARAGNEDSDVQHLLSPVRWEGPDGQQVLAFFSDSYAGFRRIFADPPTVNGGASALCTYLARYERSDYLPSDLPIVGTHADNEDLARGESEFVARWNARYAFPKLRYSTIPEYFDAVRELGDDLPVYRGDGGSYWEDGVGAAAAAMSTYRRTQVALPVAETLAALMPLALDGLVPPRAALDAAWEALHFGCEHTWTAFHVIEHAGSEESRRQTEWKVHQIDHAAQLTREHLDRALSQLGEAVSAPGRTALVFNSLSWPRTALVEVELEPGASVLDRDGEEVAVEVVADSDGRQLVRFRADDVPAFGYRTYPVRPGGPPSLILGVEGAELHTDTDTDAHPPPASALQPMSTTAETARYRVEMDRDTGRMTSLVHKELGRELVDTASPHGFGEVVYVSGGGTAQGRGLGHERTRLSDSDWFLPEPALDVIPATMVTNGVAMTPWGCRIDLVGRAPTVSGIKTEIHLRDDSDRIDVVVSFDKTETLAKESVYIAFPFAISTPEVRYDRQQGWVDPVEDHQPGACNEWLTTQYAVCLSEPDLTVAWTSHDAPLFTVADVVRGTWARQFAAPNGSLFSWVMNNYWWTNFPASQGGPHTMRYSFVPSRSWDPAAAARFGREARAPLAATGTGWLDKTEWERGPLPTGGRSLLSAELSDNVVAAVHGGQVAGSVIVRLQEVAGAGGMATVRHPFGGGGVVHRCLATEEPLEALALDADDSLSVDLAPHQVLTVRFARD